jgi:hypothetical protein
MTLKDLLYLGMLFNLSNGEEKREDLEEEGKTR